MNEDEMKMALLQVIVEMAKQDKTELDLEIIVDEDTTLLAELKLYKKL